MLKKYNKLPSYPYSLIAVMNDRQFLILLGSRIKKMRLKKDLSQYELAVLCHFQKASMSRIEAGKSNITLLNLKRISVALHVHVNELLSD